MPYSDRHHATQHLMEMLEPNPNLPKSLRDISEAVFNTANGMLTALHDGPELSAGLRHLLDAKDCFVRQGLVDWRGNGGTD